MAPIDPLAPDGQPFELELEPDADPRHRWLADAVAAGALAVGTPDARRRAHARLVEAEVLETFLGARFVGAKRFSLEGVDALVPLLDAVLDESAARGVAQVVIGTGHRGRLNLMVALGCLSREALLALFVPGAAGGAEDGDVRYHLGGEVRRGGVTVALAPNPSHVEWVNPVALGRVRARQDAGLGAGGALAVLLHGDGAFAGQGVVAETLNLARLPGYAVGGTIHVVVNNQLAFTTAPGDQRSTRHATDVARMLRVPVLRVDADDPDVVVAVGRLAAAYRAAHHDDVVIDLVGYRRRGHNEGDEPRFTQPVAYRAIDAHPTVRARHARRLDADGVATVADAEAAVRAETDAWRRALEQVRAGAAPTSRPAPAAAPWTPPRPVSAEELAAAARALAAVPDGFAAHPKVAALLAERARAVAAGGPVDVATAEGLALATLLAAGVSVRLSGQDSRRGTFAQRHAVVVDQHTGAAHAPLAGVGPGRFTVWDSPLSEAAVLGFEYGHSVDAPDALTIWEAQYGDFVNCAQVVVDELIAAGAAKWGQRSGLALFLPHGHEGHGPDHSSARVERFLELCAADNLRVCQPTTAAQLYHLIRSQARRATPLVVLTPKALLRAARAASPVAALAGGGFAPVIADDAVAVADARRVLVCSGRLYFDLVDARPPGAPVAIVRLEQLYPIADDARALLARRAPGADLVWVQEEPRNLGPWRHLADHLRDLPLGCVARPESPSPAGGSMERHRREQAALVARAFG